MSSAPTDHFRESERALEQADSIANADNWRSDQRAADVANALAKAQAHATLALAAQFQGVVYVANANAI